MTLSWSRIGSQDLTKRTLLVSASVLLFAPPPPEAEPDLGCSTERVGTSFPIRPRVESRRLERMPDLTRSGDRRRRSAVLGNLTCISSTRPARLSGPLTTSRSPARPRYRGSTAGRPRPQQWPSRAPSEDRRPFPLVLQLRRPVLARVQQDRYRAHAAAYRSTCSRPDAHAHALLAPDAPRR